VAKVWGVRRVWQRTSPTPPEETPDVHEECAQFLEGHLDEGFGGNREYAPDWVWVSVLAHASEEHLVACAALGSRSKPANRCIWDRTQSFLAGEMLDHARSRALPVSLLQHNVVIPIELGLGARPLAGSSRTATDDISSARRGGLRSHRGRGRRTTSGYGRPAFPVPRYSSAAVAGWRPGGG
jgi:hypothetical protein